MATLDTVTSKVSLTPPSTAVTSTLVLPSALPTTVEIGDDGDSGVEAPELKVLSRASSGSKVSSGSRVSPTRPLKAFDWMDFTRLAALTETVKRPWAPPTMAVTMTTALPSLTAFTLSRSPATMRTTVVSRLVTTTRLSAASAGSKVMDGTRFLPVACPFPPAVMAARATIGGLSSSGWKSSNSYTLRWTAPVESKPMTTMEKSEWTSSDKVTLTTPPLGVVTVTT